MSHIQLWPELSSFHGKLGALYQQEVPEIWERNGLSNLPGANILVNAHHAGSGGLDPEEISYRNPYANPKILPENLNSLVDAGYLTTNGHHRYLPTPQGKKAITGLMADFGKMFARPTPADDADLQRLVNLLQRLVQAGEETPPPPPKTALKASRRLDRGPDAPVMARLNRYLGDLNAYRDDAHLASWRGLGVSGPAWEAFTAIWNESANNAATLAENFSFRQYETTDYEKALAELAERGWVTGDENGDFFLTETGRAIREEAEKVTDKTFYAGWDCLEEEEIAELQALIQRVGDAFQPPVA